MRSWWPLWPRIGCLLKAVKPLNCTDIDPLSVDPATLAAILGLGGAGVSALWKIAGGLGRFEAKTTTILGAMQIMLEDHEDRLRAIERKY